MDPISLAIAALIAGGAGPAAAAGSAAAAPVIAGAATAVATAPAWAVPAAAVAAGAGVGSAGVAGSLGGAVNANPVAQQGAEAAFNDVSNQAAIGSVNANNAAADALNPHLPPEFHIEYRNFGY